MIDRGIDHPKAVKFVTFLCLSIGGGYLLRSDGYR